MFTITKTITPLLKKGQKLSLKMLEDIAKSYPGEMAHLTLQALITAKVVKEIKK